MRKGDHMQRKVVVPGELVAKGRYRLGEGVYRVGDEIYASVLGLLDIKGSYVKVIPLAGRYIPKPGDYVIGIVKDIQPSFWILDINSPYDGILNVNEFIREVDPSTEDLYKLLPVGSVVHALVKDVNRAKKVLLTLKDKKARILRKGRLIEIEPTKVPRVIGRRSSMISMIKKETKSSIIVAQNGRIWIKTDIDTTKFIEKLIRIIEKEAHTSGLTDRIKGIIDSELKSEEKGENNEGGKA